MATPANNELLIFTEDVAFLNGRYREPGSETWNEVGVIFSLDHKVQRIVNRSNESDALAVITIPAGSEFQAYNAIVTADNRVISEPGNTVPLAARWADLGMGAGTQRQLRYRSVGDSLWWQRRALRRRLSM